MTVAIKRIDKETHYLREELNCSQEKMAHIIGVSTRTIARWENGENVPHELALRRIRELHRIFEKMNGVIKEGKKGEWLRTPNEALGNKTPIETMEQGFAGVMEVERLLGKIEWGIPT